MKSACATGIVGVHAKMLSHPPVSSIVYSRGPAATFVALYVGDGSVFEGIKAAIVRDRYAYFKDFFNTFYNVDVLGGTRITEHTPRARTANGESAPLCGGS